MSLLRIFKTFAHRQVPERAGKKRNPNMKEVKNAKYN
jgi:hypothetical protein